MSEENGYLPYQLFDDPEKFKDAQLPISAVLFNKLRNINPFRLNYLEFTNTLDGIMTTKQAFLKMMCTQSLQIGQEKYQYFLKV